MDIKKNYDNIEDIMLALTEYIPEESVPVVQKWFEDHKFSLRITRSRMTKLGDYQHPWRGYPHRISINRDLNKYLFLITLAHEVAHLISWNKYRNDILPHGKEWKNEFSILIREFIQMNIFPDDIIQYLEHYSHNPKASSCSDTNLTRILKKYDTTSDVKHLEELDENVIFRIQNGRTFIKGKRVRKRFLCTEIYSKKKYLISPVTEVMQTSLF